MTTYYIMEEGKITFADDDKQRLVNTLPFINKTEADILETEEAIENFMFVDSEEWVEWKSQELRGIRDRYLVEYVDPVVSNPLRWAETSEEDKAKMAEYRRYLLDITKTEGYPKNITIKTYEEYFA